ncbi:MAG: hypothetical protein ABIF18_02355 [archaeon]
MLRKIKTQAEIDKKKRRNQFFIGVIMIGLLVVSTLGYSLISSDTNEDSKKNEFGIEFFRENGLWIAIIDEEVFRFQNLPSEISDIDVNVSLDLEKYSGQPLYFVNPNVGASEILNNIGSYILRYQEACLTNESCGNDIPAKSCENNLIIFEIGNETKVYQNESCIFIVGDGIKGADAFLYKVLGVN